MYGYTSFEFLSLTQTETPNPGQTAHLIAIPDALLCLLPHGSGCMHDFKPQRSTVPLSKKRQDQKSKGSLEGCGMRSEVFAHHPYISRPLLAEVKGLP